MDISGTDCDRARESVSADLDDELQELELRRLQAHLRVCADCAAWAERTRVTTVELRESAREALAAAAFVPPRRGRTWSVRPLAAPAAAALAIAAVAFGGAQHGLFSGQRTTSTPQRPTGPYLVQDGLGFDVYMYRLPVHHPVLQSV